MALSMARTLIASHADRFSKSARPVPLHRDAARDDAGVRPLAVVARGFTNHLTEGAAERPQALKSDVERDLGHGPVGLAQQRHRPLDPAALQVAVGRLAEGGAEAADEVGAREGDRAGQPLDVERVGVAAVHRVAGPKQPPVDHVARFAGHYSPGGCRSTKPPASRGWSVQRVPPPRLPVSKRRPSTTMNAWPSLA